MTSKANPQIHCRHNDSQVESSETQSFDQSDKMQLSFKAAGLSHEMNVYYQNKITAEVDSFVSSSKE